MNDHANASHLPRHYIVVAAADAVDAARAGGYVEINRGKAGPLERLRDGDVVLYYSPRHAEGGPPLQAFTALAIVDGALHQAETPDKPFRRAARHRDVHPAPIRPLIDVLDFIRNKAHWGAPLRFGFVQLSAADSARIAQALGADDGTAATVASPEPGTQARRNG
jgi:EVE domain